MADRITLSALALRPDGSGVQTYIRELLRELTHVSTARLAAVVQRDAVGEVAAGIEIDPRPVSSGARRAVQALRSVGPTDLVHGLDVDLPLRPGAPTLTTVHDLSVFDVAWAHPGVRAAGERALIRQALRRADSIVAVSAFTAERVKARFGREATVTHLAPGPDMVRPPDDDIESLRRRMDLHEPWVLHVGTVEPRKDVATLAAACAEAGLPLVLAGAVAGGATVPTTARHLGYVDRADLPALYAAATIVAYPSRYEGFGLPPIEAMACGAPVVTTNVTSIPEVVGDAALLVPPQDVDALRAALEELAHDTDRRAELAEAGRRHVGKMSWTRTAEETVAVYRTLGIDA